MYFWIGSRTVERLGANEVGSLAKKTFVAVSLAPSHQIDILDSIDENSCHFIT
jgi:hypothetical protein